MRRSVGARRHENEMNYEIGSIFRKWDLHVHTPASIKKGSFTGPDAWERWFDDVEKLPSEFAVIGINDYTFIEGYRRVREAHKAGRLSNIKLFLPVVELRLAIFSGSGSDLRRVNLHVIFSDELDPDVIEQQFLSRLGGDYRLDPNLDNVTWSGALTKESLADLGDRIRAAAPPDKQATIPGGLQTGFYNLTVERGRVEQALSSSYLTAKHMLAIGKAEWDQIRWDQAAGDKRTIVNAADFLFTANDSPAQWQRGYERLKAENVNSRLLDCSDAHHYSSSDEKDRVGNCMTWIKADPTFQGLQLARREYEERVFVGDTPAIVRRQRQQPTKIIRTVAIRKRPNSDLQEDWFDTQLDLNPGLIAIIGRKGNGKSALADIVGLLGNSENERFFSFLSDQKFRQPKSNKAAHFVATLTWESGQNTTRGLEELVPPGKICSVTFLPQRFLEEICDDVTVGKTGFDRELEAVIFSHVSEADRLGKASLGELVAYSAELLREKVAQRRQELASTSEMIAELEGQLRPEQRARLEAQIAQKEGELLAHDRARPPAASKPEDDPSRAAAMVALTDRINTLRGQKEQVVQRLELATEERNASMRRLARIERAEQRIGNLQDQYRSFRQAWREDAEIEALGLDLDDLVTMTVNGQPLETLRKATEELRAERDRELDPNVSDSAAFRAAALERLLEDAQQALDAPNRIYQSFLEESAKWMKQRETLVGSAKDPTSLEGLRARLAGLDTLGPRLTALRQKRLEHSRAIYDLLQELGNVYRSLYKPVQDFVANHPLARDKFQLRFGVLMVDTGFADRFLSEYITQGATGSFCGKDEGRTRLRAILDHVDFQTAGGVEEFLTSIVEHLERDFRTSATATIPVESQLRVRKTAQDLFNFLYGLSYIEPRYVLKWYTRELSQLSPGERGTLLLVFYLLVDKNDTPLIIDQPEDNLDNETVYSLLVPTVREARTRRQVVIVTHNPNLAVVCDADQVIYASRDKAASQRISYETGALENPRINRRVVDVLEGTRPAFDKRDEKYFVT